MAVILLSVLHTDKGPLRGQRRSGRRRAGRFGARSGDQRPRARDPAAQLGQLAVGCHLLFVPASDARQVLAKINKGSEPMLTVSDAPGFAQSGGMIELVQES